MAGCGGNCQCAARKLELNQTKDIVVPGVTPIERRTLVDSIAQVIVDGRLALRALEIYEEGVLSKEDAIAQARLDISQH